MALTRPTVWRRHRLLKVAGVALPGLAVGAASWVLRDADSWWSSTLGNVAVALLLLVPGELALTWVASGFRRIERATDDARETAEVARETAERTEQSLEDVRKILLDRQVAEHEADLDVYRDMVRRPSLGTLVAALRKATDEGLISANGARSPVWETNLHYRYVVSDTGNLEVRLEEDDGTVLNGHDWSPDDPPETFYQRLVQAVRDAEADLGVNLNDPTQSVQELSEMLIEVTRLRAQEVMGYRPYLSRIIERVDGWYFTERYVIPADDLQYGIRIDRLDELDWEEQLRGKGWYGAGSALKFARKLYGLDDRDAPTPG